MVTVDQSELLELFENLYAEESAAKDTLKTVQTDLKAYAEKIETKPKAVKAAYARFKKLKDDPEPEELDDGDALTALVEKYFEG